MKLIVSTSAKSPDVVAPHKSFTRYIKSLNEFYVEIRGGEYESFFKNNKSTLFKALKNVPLKELTSVLSDTLCDALYPSEWPYGPYPGKLAQALVASKAEESLTDLTHPYYSSNRQLTASARKVFMDFLLAHPKKVFEEAAYQFGCHPKDLAAGGEVLKKALPDHGWENVSQGFRGFMKDDPKAAKKILLLLPKTHLDAIVASEEEYKGKKLASKKRK